jgi:hypothetical protein
LGAIYVKWYHECPKYQASLLAPDFLLQVSFLNTYDDCPSQCWAVIKILHQITDSYPGMFLKDI